MGLSVEQAKELVLPVRYDAVEVACPRSAGSRFRKWRPVPRDKTSDYLAAISEIEICESVFGVDVIRNTDWMLRSCVE